MTAMGRAREGVGHRPPTTAAGNEKEQSMNSSVKLAVAYIS